LRAERIVADVLADQLTRLGVRAYGTVDIDARPCIVIYLDEADLVCDVIKWARAKGAKITKIWFRREVT
jgi:hypothetical protein